MRFCECGEALPEDARVERFYCSNACRQRHYRERKKLLAPFGGDIHAAFAAALANMEKLTASVTDNSDEGRNA